jgi:hypothetical protein
LYKNFKAILKLFNRTTLDIYGSFDYIIKASESCNPKAKPKPKEKAKRKMKINEQNICLDANNKNFVALKWYWGASRYNNGATIYGKKYFIRLVMNWAKKSNK